MHSSKPDDARAALLSDNRRRILKRSLPLGVRIDGRTAVAGQNTRAMATIQSVSKQTLCSLVLAAITAAFIGSAPLSAQERGTDNKEVWGEVFAGSELEQYLRLLQLTGESKRLPWSVRSFGPAELRQIAPSGGDHPWAGRYDFTGDSTGLLLSFVRPAAGLAYNSRFPYGSNDGAIWAGRGLTGSIQVGAAFRFGPLSGVFAPTLFAAGNADFDLMPTRQGVSVYRDPRYPTSIDLPQRFGDGTYSRAELGQSTLRLDYRGAALGISTANQHWGPAREYPMLLGTNAAGFPHVFAGTSTPLSLWIGSLHGRVVWGALDQSDYSPMPADDGDRLMTGLIATFSPRFPEGLEVGLGRFYHIIGSTDDIDSDFITKPFDAFLKRNLDDTSPAMSANQLASIHARWVFPEAGFEVYGEFAREDHNFDLRDLIIQPDHDSGFVLGFQRVWRRDSGYWTLRGEVTEAEVSNLVNVRAQVPFYLHTRARQGHTHRGQLLGSPAVYGGSGALIALDHHHAGGRITAFAERALRNELRYPSTSNLDRSQLDVLLTSGVEALFFKGPVEVTTGLSGSLNMNRDFAGDAFNLNARLLLRAAL